MEFEIQDILVLLGGDSNEEKVAGLMMSEKLLEMDKLNPEESTAFLNQAYSLISPDFIIRLMWNNEKRFVFRQACISMMASSIQMGFACVFRDYATRLIDLLFSAVEFNSKVQLGEVSPEVAAASDEEQDKQFVLDLLLTVKWIAADGDSIQIEKIIRHTLLHVGKPTTELPVYFYPSLLDFVGDVCQLGATSDFYCEPVMDTDGLEEKLRMLLVKGFHGGAPEVVRDSSLHNCLRFLKANLSFSPQWSIENIKKGGDISVIDFEAEVIENATGKTETDDKDKDKEETPSTGKFAMLLVSIVGIEVYLLLEEALALFKQPQGEPQEPVYGDIRDPKEARKKAYDEVKLNNSEEYTTLRMSRLVKMIPHCMSLISTVLQLLVGGDNDDGEPYIGHWSVLSSPAILHIRQTIHNIFQKIFDFLKEISDVSEITLSNISNRNKEGVKGAVMDRSDMNDKLLVMIVQQVTAALTLWVLDDEDIRGPFMQNLPLMLRWSAVPTHYNTKQPSKKSKKSDKDKPTAATVWKALYTIPHAEEGEEISDIGDVLHFILPCLAEISGTLARDDELADKICTIEGGSLFSRLVNIAVLVGQNAKFLVKEDQRINGGKTGKVDIIKKKQDELLLAATGFERLCYTTCCGCVVLTALLNWRKKDIITLRRGETETEALCAVFSLTAENFPYIPPPADNMYMANSSRSVEESHADRLSDLLATASGHFNYEEDDSVCITSDLIESLDGAVNELCSVLIDISSD